MIKKIIAAVFALVVLALATGCSTLAETRDAKGSGLSRVYDAPVETVWKKMLAVVSDADLQLVNDNRAEGYILAKSGVTALSYGEKVATFIEPADGATKTRVEVVSKKVIATNIFAPSWEKELLDKLDEKLKTKKAPA